ncbi:MAG: MarC family protein [Nanoarchaeota archaeon]
MGPELLQLFILFLVIFDPLVSFSVFFAATSNMSGVERRKIAMLSLGVAIGLSFLVLFFGTSLLALFSTTLDEFRVAGGIILSILGIKMTLGMSLTTTTKSSGSAIAAIIGSPLLTGPAAITAIIVSTEDFGTGLTAVALTAVFMLLAVIFFQARLFRRLVGETAVQIISTVLGMITLSWGVRFIIDGLRGIGAL